MDVREIATEKSGACDFEGLDKEHGHQEEPRDDHRQDGDQAVSYGTHESPVDGWRGLPDDVERLSELGEDPCSPVKEEERTHRGRHDGRRPSGHAIGKAPQQSNGLVAEPLPRRVGEKELHRIAVQYHSRDGHEDHDQWCDREDRVVGQGGGHQGHPVFAPLGQNG